MRIKKYAVSDEEIQKSLAEQRAELARQIEIHNSVEAQKKLVERIKEEKEIRQDNKDKEEQESRGNRVTYSSIILRDLCPLIIFLLIFIGLFAFVEFYIVPQYGW